MDTVLLVHQGYQWIRGSERFLIDHISQLDRSRFRPVLWTNNRPLAEAVEIPVHIDRFTSLLTGSAPRHDILNYVRLLGRAREIIRKYDVRLIHCNAPEPCQWVIPASGRIPVILQLHLDVYGLRLRTLSLTHRASALVGVAQTTLDPFISDGYTGPAKVVHNCIDPTRLTSYPKVELNLSGPIILAVGFLIPLKGFDLLIEAFRPHAHRATLLIVGDGPERAKLEHQAAGLPVMFLGDRPDAAAVMRDVGGIFVLPSRAEAFPMVLLEAGFFGLPCIATDVGGVSELIGPETGMLVSAERLSSAIGEMLDSPVMARTFGLALQARVLREFIAPRSTRSIEAIYKENLDGFRRVGLQPYARILQKKIARWHRGLS